MSDKAETVKEETISEEVSKPNRKKGFLLILIIALALLALIIWAIIPMREFVSDPVRLRAYMDDKGIAACVPALDERFDVKIETKLTALKPDFHADSKWSERHAAYACGLGTFGLSKGLITEKGMAGRFASIIVSEVFGPDPLHAAAGRRGKRTLRHRGL